MLQGLTSDLFYDPSWADGLTCDKFDSSWRMVSEVAKCSIADVDEFVESHYLGKRPAVVLLCLMMKCNNQPVGCICYSAPPLQASKRYNCETWELARLFIVDEVPRNAETWLIGKSVKHIKRTQPTVGCLVSYADPSADHKGTIYKAANWRTDGMTDEGRKTPRSDYVDKNTGIKYGRKGNVPDGADLGTIPRVSKHRFYLRLK